MHVPGSREVAIIISQDYMNGASIIELARTLIHESIHAEIFSEIMESANGRKELGTHSNFSNDADFRHLWVIYSGMNDVQHEFMADQYRQILAAGINDFLSRNNVGISFTSEEVNLLVWRGLEGTREYDLQQGLNPEFKIRYDEVRKKVKQAIKDC